MCRVLGWFDNIVIERKMEDIEDRPNDDNIDIFSKVKMPIYHKSLAFNKYHKRRLEGFDLRCWYSPNSFIMTAGIQGTVIENRTYHIINIIIHNEENNKWFKICQVFLPPPDEEFIRG